MLNEFDPHEYLAQLGGFADDQIDLALAALALALVDHQGVSADRYLNHLHQIVKDVAAVFEEGGEGVHDKLAALRSVLSDQYDYTGDVQNYDDLQNASLVRTIDRAKGLPITLAILYIHAGRGLGWDVEGLNLPGHFVCRVEHEGERLIFDPFLDGKILEAPDLRGYIKKALGPHAELSAAYYEPANNREILIRLQNNIKYRKIDAEDYKGALDVVERMRMIDPEDWNLFLDAGVLYARTEQPMVAIENLRAYLERAPDSRERYEAQMLLNDLSGQLN